MPLKEDMHLVKWMKKREDRNIPEGIKKQTKKAVQMR